MVERRGGGADASGEAGLAARLDARFAADRRRFRREAWVVSLLLAGACAAWWTWSRGVEMLWPLAPELRGPLALLVLLPLALDLLALRVPSRAARIARLDAELGARGALVAGAECAADANAVAALLRRALARRLQEPLPSAARGAERARRRARLLRWGLLGLLLLLWFLLLRALLGPGGPAPRGAEGELAGERRAESGAGSAAGAPAEASRAAESAPEDEPAEGEEAPPDHEERSEEGGGETPPPPALERRLEDFFVRLREQAGGAANRELWVVPLAPAEGPGDAGAAGGEAEQDAARAGAPRENFRGADAEELKRAAERAQLPAALGARERAWVERYFEALKKLP
jgi:hypothetical protein